MVFKNISCAVLGSPNVLKSLSPYFCATMTIEQIKDMRDRVSVLRRFL